MIPEDTTVVAGIPIPSTSPVFLAVVALHVLVGLVCVVAGAVAMLSPKRTGRHPTFGTIYYWGLVVVFVTASGLSVVRWAENYHVDNGKNLPLWKELPPIAYWVLPATIGLPLIIRAVLKHPLARQ